MRRASFSSKNGRRAAKALVGLAILTSLACDNSMNFNPVAPQWPDWQNLTPGTRTIEIDGTLQVQDGALYEATVLYDGLEVPGARSHCPDPAGCTSIQLEATFLTATGHHSIAFQVLRQSREVVDYRAEGTVVVSRENLDLGFEFPPIPLGPSNASLAAGDAVIFDIHFTD